MERRTKGEWGEREEKNLASFWWNAQGEGEFLGDTISVCCVLTNYHFETGVGEEWLLGSHLEDWWTVLKWLSFSNPPSGPAHLCSPLPLNFKTFSEHSTPPTHTNYWVIWCCLYVHEFKSWLCEGVVPQRKDKKKQKSPKLFLSQQSLVAWSSSSLATPGKFPPPTLPCPVGVGMTLVLFRSPYF